jgi:oligo-1,6-glucosidase
MVFGFEHFLLDQEPGFDKYALKVLHLPDLKKNLAKWQEGMADEGWNSLFWDNHDQPRAVSRFGDDSPEHRVASAKTLATVLHLHKGTPYVYQGEELGMTNARLVAITDYRDIEALNYHAGALAAGAPEELVLTGLAAKSRDNARTPMCWSDAPMAGFTTGTPWIAVNGNFREINAASQVGDPASVFAHYRTLIDLRHDDEVVREGRFELLLGDHDKLWAFTRTLGHRQLLVVANMTSTVVGVPMGELPDLTGARLVLTNLPDVSGDPQTLEPWESRIYELEV